MAFTPDPKPTPRNKSKNGTEKPNERICKWCKEKYMMLPSVRAQRSMTPLKRCCRKEECENKAVDKMFADKRAQDRKDWNKRKKQEKIKLKGLPEWKKDLQIVVNWIARELDKDQKCISHPDMKGFLRYDAGHYFTVKAHSDLRYNLHNIHKQNSQANERYGGDANYTIGLINRYGQEYVDMVLGLKLKYKGVGKLRYTIENIQTKYLPAARKVKREIQNGFLPTRDQVNELIGIYDAPKYEDNRQTKK